MKNADSVYIENLNRELSLLDDVNPVDIYKALEKFVQNKSLFKDFVESGGFRFEYIWYRMLIKDSVWEDGITSIIAVYRDTKNKNAQAAIDWLCKCIQEFDSAGEKWNLKARDMVENDNGRMDIELNKTMEFIGGVIEGVIKTYICFVNGCFSIQNGKVADPTIDLGVMTHNIIDKDAIFSAIYQDMLENEKISDWRNVANHEKYSLLSDDSIELIFGKKDKTRKKLSTIKNIRIIAKQIDMLAYMNKIAVEIIKIDEIENISNILQIKSKNKYKKNDDRIAATIEYAAKCGLRMIDLDIENGGAVFVETIFDKENFEEFLNNMRLLFAEIDLNIIVYKSEKVHYTTNLTDKFGKVMVWKV